MSTTELESTSIAVDEASASDPAGLTGAIAQLANQLFSALPTPAPELPWTLARAAAPTQPPTTFVPAVSPTTGALQGSPGVTAPPHFGPSALALGPGASPAVSFPPTPGPLQTPPLASAPPPKESDLRAVPTLFADQIGLPSAFSLAQALPEPSADPYFMKIAGLPAGESHGARTPQTGAEPSGAFATTGREPQPGELDLRGDRRLRSGLFDAHAIRRDFPILSERVNGRPLVWLDNAATTQKPRAVIERLTHFYEHENSNVHRGAHTLAARATDAYESGRESVRRFLNASSTQEIVFVRGATEAINLVAQTWGRRHVGPGDEIVITWLEHHANIVPWQQLCSEKGARLRVAPVDERGQIRLDEFEKLLGPRTRLVSLSQVSNALGTVTPAREMVQIAHRYGACVLVDGAQAVSHMPVDVQVLDCDFYVFSGHKVFAPTGIGALFGKLPVLESMPPWQGGGNMIADVTFERTQYQPAPFKFEAGTGNIADAAGLGAALDYVRGLGIENIARYEHELLVYGTERLLEVPGLHLVGTAQEKAGVLSFVLDGQRTEDVGGALNQQGIAVRSGHHCAQPILRRFGLEASVRASLAFYNTCEDIDALAAALHRIQASRPR